MMICATGRTGGAAPREISFSLHYNNIITSALINAYRPPPPDDGGFRFALFIAFRVYVSVKYLPGRAHIIRTQTCTPYYRY